MILTGVQHQESLLRPLVEILVPVQAIKKKKKVDHNFFSYKMNLLDKIILRSLFSIEIS